LQIFTLIHKDLKLKVGIIHSNARATQSPVLLNVKFQSI